MNLPEGVKAGDTVTAKRAGWDEQLDAVQEFDFEPYADHEYDSPDLSGKLSVVEAPDVTVYLVGGQEADPKTIQLANEPSGAKSIRKGWVTIGAHGGKDEEGKHGGTHVFIGQGGNIEKGPAHLVGHKPHEIPKKKPKPANNLPAPHGEGKPAGAENKEAGPSMGKKPSISPRFAKVIGPAGKGKGEFATVHISDLQFPGGLGDEVEPLKNNSNKPIIVAETEKGFMLIDGWGRASGMNNAGKEEIHAIIVTKGDLSERTTDGDDEDWNREMYRRYVPDLEYHGTTN